MLFLIFITLIAGLQVLHRRLLHQVFDRRFDRWVVLALVLIHTPLAAYMAFRLTGAGNSVVWLRPLARAGAYFQLRHRHEPAGLGRIQPGLALDPPVALPPAEPPEDPQRRKFLRQTSLVGVTLAGFTVVRGTLEARSDPDIIRQELSFPDLPPGLDGLRMVQISDLHAGPLVRAEQVQRWRRLAEGERPELLLITGDIVDSLPHEAGPVAEAFRGFRAPLGCYAILGNHDYFTDPRPIWRSLEGIGVGFLENRHALVERRGGTLAVMGLQDPMARHGRFRDIAYGPGPRPDLAAAGHPRRRLAPVPQPPPQRLAPGPADRRPPHPFRPHPRRAGEPHSRRLQRPHAGPIHPGPVPRGRPDPLRQPGSGRRRPAHQDRRAARDHRHHPAAGVKTPSPEGPGTGSISIHASAAPSSSG